MSKTALSDALALKTLSERATFKAQEIVKINPIGEHLFSDIKLELQSLKEINVNGKGGVEIFARAWKNGKQLGFGKDGSVEIERFRIFNPPILVDDPNGNIIRESFDKFTGEIKVRKLREDPVQAIRDTLISIVRLVGKENGKIVTGKIGNTTSTFYPDAHTETASCDGIVGRDTANEAWATIRDTAGNWVNDTVNDYAWGNLIQSGVSSGWMNFLRTFAFFDTSSIPDTDVIDSAILSIYGTSKTDAHNCTPDVGVYGTTSTGTTALANADYQKYLSTAFSSTISYANWSTAGFNDFALNADGLANISKTGLSRFCIRNVKHDVANTEPSRGGNNLQSATKGYFADQTGTSNDPKLVVVHSSPVVGPAKLKTMNTLATAKIKTIDGLAIAKIKTIDTLA